MSGVNKATREAQEKSMIIIDTVDYHPERHISFASYWGKPAFHKTLYIQIIQMISSGQTNGVGGTKDVNLIEGIIDPVDSVKIYKGWMRNRDAYSAFDMGVKKLQGNARFGYEVDAGAKTLVEVLHGSENQDTSSCWSRNRSL